MVNLFNFCVFHPILIRFGLGTKLGLKTTENESEIATAIFLLTTTTQTTDGGGVRGSNGRGSKGPHNHQQDINMIGVIGELFLVGR